MVRYISKYTPHNKILVFRGNKKNYPSALPFGGSRVPLCFIQLVLPLYCNSFYMLFCMFSHPAVFLRIGFYRLVTRMTVWIATQSCPLTHISVCLVLGTFTAFGRGGILLVLRPSMYYTATFVHSVYEESELDLQLD